MVFLATDLRLRYTRQMPKHLETRIVDGVTLPVLDVRQNIVILTGAGISAESGLKTFRESNGLWEEYRIEDVATPQAFARNPELVQNFYNMRRRQLKTAEPNLAHAALAELEKKWQGEFLLVTQNVDNLHSRAGSRKLLHMHGELEKVSCQRTLEVFSWKEDITPATRCPCCDETGTLRPYIVWFGEVPLHMDEIYDALRRCDVFMAIGTSGQVYPAAGFVQEAKFRNANTIECNLEASKNSAFGMGVYGRATERVYAITRLAS